MKNNHYNHNVTRRFTWLLLSSALLTVPLAQAQPFISGSTGAYGAMNITSNTTLDMPSNGVFHCTTITVASGVTLKFNRNPLNTPVYLLAQSNILVQGTIDVSGGLGNSQVGGAGGPGGFDGGPAGQLGYPPGAGQGPGAGGVVTNSQYVGANASFGTLGSTPYGTAQSGSGATYGNALLVPLVGGSGGGGSMPPGAGYSGGGGGGGGGVRLIAPIVRTGVSTIDLLGGPSAYGGYGRARIDTTDRRFINGSTLTGGPWTVGANMVVFPIPTPQLSIIQAAGTVIAEGTPAPVQIQLPYNSTTNRTVTVQARDFNAVVLVDVLLTPESGASVKYQTNIDNTVVNPATAVVNVVVPVNTVVNVKAWTR